MEQPSNTENLVEQALNALENCFHSICNTVRDFWEYYFNR